MLNQIVVVGRIADDPVVQEIDDKKVSNITLAVSRPFKNSKGEYETDFLPFSLWNGIAENTAEYCKKGDLIAVKGRMQAKDNKLSIVAEKLSFLQSSYTKKDEIEEKDIKI